MNIKLYDAECYFVAEINTSRVSANCNLVEYQQKFYVRISKEQFQQASKVRVFADEVLS